MTVQRDTGRPWPNDWDGVGTSRSRAGMPPVLRPRRLGSVPVRSHVAIEPPTGGTNRPRFGPAPTGGDTRPDFITLRDQSSVRWTRRIRLVCVATWPPAGPLCATELICAAMRVVGKADRRPTLQSVVVVRSRGLRLALNSKHVGRAIVPARPRPLARPRRARAAGSSRRLGCCPKVADGRGWAVWKAKPVRRVTVRGVQVCAPCGGPRGCASDSGRR
jgi:hypothetical protein